MWLLIYSYLIGGGAARLAETQPLTEERVVRPPPCVRDPTMAWREAPLCAKRMATQRTLAREARLREAHRAKRGRHKPHLCGHVPVMPFV